MEVYTHWLLSFTLRLRDISHTKRPDFVSNMFFGPLELLINEVQSSHDIVVIIYLEVLNFWQLIGKIIPT